MASLRLFICFWLLSFTLNAQTTDSLQKRASPKPITSKEGEGWTPYRSLLTRYYGYKNRAGEKVLKPTIFLSAEPFSEGLGLVSADISVKTELIHNYRGDPGIKSYIQRLYYFINTNGEPVFGRAFTNAEPFRNGRARVSDNKNNVFYIDRAGNCVENCQTVFVRLPVPPPSAEWSQNVRENRHFRYGCIGLGCGGCILLIVPYAILGIL